MNRKLCLALIILTMSVSVLFGCTGNIPADIETETESFAETETAFKVTEPIITTSVSTTPEETTEETTKETTEEMIFRDIAFLPAGTELSEAEVEAYGEEHCFYVEPISDEIFYRIDGITFKDYSPVDLDDIRYIRCLHKNEEGRIFIGELIMHADLAEEICEIFHELYKGSYPIEKMLLADEYDADDEASMADNNTSGFNVRYVEFSTELSLHAYGRAIDINPLYNPYYITSQDQAFPENGYEYAKDRDQDFPYKITQDDLCCRLFIERGYTWGGNWGWPDYQHFEK